jgi:hypothetical protein
VGGSQKLGVRFKGMEKKRRKGMSKRKNEGVRE